MRSKIDAKISVLTSRSGKKVVRPPGGKVMQRLIAYLGARDPALNAEVAAAIPAAAVQLGLAKPSSAKGARRSAKAPRRKGGGASAAKSLASAITKAAVGIIRRAPSAAARNRPGAASAGAPAWT